MLHMWVIHIQLSSMGFERGTIKDKAEAIRVVQHVNKEQIMKRLFKC